MSTALLLAQGVPSTLNGAYFAAVLLSVLVLVLHRVRPWLGLGGLVLVLVLFLSIGNGIGWDDSIVACLIAAAPLLGTRWLEGLLARRRRAAPPPEPAPPPPPPPPPADAPRVCIGCGAAVAGGTSRCPYCGRPEI